MIDGFYEERCSQRAVPFFCLLILFYRDRKTSVHSFHCKYIFEKEMKWIRGNSAMNVDHAQK